MSPQSVASPLSIIEFCRFIGISRSLYYRLRLLGLGPRVLRLGRRVLIPAHEVIPWLKSREDDDGAP